MTLIRSYDRWKKYEKISESNNLINKIIIMYLK